MMKKFVIIAVGFALALSFAIGVSKSVADTMTGPAEMTLTTAAAKKPATFPHAKHQEKLECASCHHGKDDAGKQVPFAAGMKIQKCVTCHNADDMTDKKLNSFKGVAHEKCKGCHKESGGPTKCTGCHVK